MHRETPAWAERMLRVAGGNNRFGDPNFRVTWGENLMDWVGGKFEDRDASGKVIREVKELRWAMKYPWCAHRWVVEKWQGPAQSDLPVALQERFPNGIFGTPETWFRRTKEWGEEGNIPQLGPYPYRGRYQFCAVLDIDGKFVQLTPSVLEDVIYAAIYKQNHLPSLAELKQAQAEKEKRWMQECRDILDRPAFNANEFVTVI